MKSNNNCRPEVGEFIRRKAFAAGFSVTELAKRAELDRVLLNQILFHRHQAKRETFVRIGEMIGQREELLRLAGYNSNGLPDPPPAPDLIAETSLKQFLEWALKQPPHVQQFCADLVGSVTRFAKQMEAQ